MASVALACARSGNSQEALRPQGNLVFAAIVGGGVANEKAACAIAAQIEEDLILQDWPSGRNCGSEAQLAERFGVGRAVVREAARILESRHTARMRRGPGGGLLVATPAISGVIEAIGRYLAFHGKGEFAERYHWTIRAAYDRYIALKPHEDRTSSFALFLQALIEAIDVPAKGLSSGMALTRPAQGGQSRAGQILRQMMEDLNGEEPQERKLGSEFDLCERYGADRDALRQAVRVLEFEGIARSIAGRGKGLMTRVPAPNALCRLINCHFAATKVAPRDAMDFFKELSMEVVALAARNATRSDRDQLLAAHRTLLAPEIRLTAMVMQRAEQSQFAVVRDPLVDMLLRCTKSYSSWSSPLRNPDNQEIGNEYRIETVKVIRAILSGDAAAAAAAQGEKVERLNSLI